MWRADTGQLPDCWPPAAISVPLLNRALGKNMMEELTGKDKDRDTTYITITGRTESTWGKLILFTLN